MNSKQTHTLSFGILDDLSFDNGYGPVHIGFNTYNELTQLIINLTSKLRHDPSDFFTNDNYAQLFDGIAESLQENGYYVCNGYNKYYTIAFAIDYKIFNIFCKEFKKQKINWLIPKRLKIRYSCLPKTLVCEINKYF